MIETNPSSFDLETGFTLAQQGEAGRGWTGTGVRPTRPTRDYTGTGTPPDFAGSGKPMGPGAKPRAARVVRTVEVRKDRLVRPVKPVL